MKIKISKILFVLSVCGLLYSCDKFFEVDLREQMDEDKVVNNEDYLARLWAGLYWAMEDGFTAVGNGDYISNSPQSSPVTYTVGGGSGNQGGGEEGGRVVASGTPEDIRRAAESRTGRFL